MVLVVLLGLSWLCAPLGALVMDFSVKNSADKQGDQEDSECASDDDCGTGKFCIKLRKGEPFCATCRRTRRRCQHDIMCCPGMLCVNSESAQSSTGPLCSDEAEAAPGCLYSTGKRTPRAGDGDNGAPSSAKQTHEEAKYWNVTNREG
ncbi:dickkopf-related protein 4-like [Oryx dammah]|uniref:dickkopf-related protein 4-like n=1 Tax=Oryx dammah TaxID=59534 RepID=UPI001A9B2ADE|nr:dickkopf-related protein 4-like [Oryx dammah]